MSKKLNGIGASNGIAIAKVFKLEEVDLNITDEKISDCEKEIAKLNIAVNKAKTDIENLEQMAKVKLGEEKATIFKAHNQILQDPAMLDEIKALVNEQKYNVAYAVDNVTLKYREMFEMMDDPYFKERASDIKDVAVRLIKYLLNIPVIDLAIINEKVIIVSNDLTPSETAQLNPQFVCGFACNVGGRTSHAAIMARSLEIPAVLGLKNITDSILQSDMIIINGQTGEVVIEPTKQEIDSWEAKRNNWIKEAKALLSLKDKPTLSKDNYKFILEGNIGAPKDVDAVLQYGGEGVGLFRSEFLYMDNDHFPTEEEQFTAYKEVLEKMDNKVVIIRTLDIGGDKTLSYFKFPEEMNPFLGYRAIRLCLDKEDVFRTQLRALLRASVYGQLGIMFPMIATIEEFQSAKRITLEEKANLIKQGHKVSDNLEIGMMIEVPATAVQASEFAKYADFFSIGTNDLIQYTMAADRMSESVTYLYQPYNPAILRLIKMTIDGAHAQSKWVGMCGEMAGDEIAIPLLMGMKLDYFSMSATSILKARQIISQLNQKDMEKLVEQALSLATNDQVIELVKQYSK